MTGVSQILSEMAATAAQAQIARGNTYGQLVAQASQVPAQILDDRERQRIRDFQQASEQQRLELALRADQRATADQAYQDTTRAAALEHDRIVRAGLIAAMGPEGDPSKFDAKAAFQKVSALGRPDALADVVKMHQAMRTAPLFKKEGETGVDPYSYQPIPGLEPTPKLPEYGTPAYEVYNNSLLGGAPAPVGPTPPAAGPPGPMSTSAAPIGTPPSASAPPVYAARLTQLQTGPTAPAAPPVDTPAPIAPAAPPAWDAAGNFVGATTIGPPPAPAVSATSPTSATGAPAVRLTPAQVTAAAYAKQRADNEAARTPDNEFVAFKASYPATIRPGATWDTLTPDQQQAGLTAYAQRGRDPNSAAQLGILRNLSIGLANQKLEDAKRTGAPIPVIYQRPSKEQFNAVEPTTGQTYGALFEGGLVYALEGKYPPVGMGQSKQASNVRNAIAAAGAGMADEAGIDLPLLRADYGGKAAALKKLIPAAAFTASSAGAAMDNLDLALAQSDQVPRGGAKLVNRYTNWFKGELTPATGLSQLETYIYTAAREYAKVVSGSAQSVAGLSDTAAKEAEKLLNAAQAPDTFAAVATAMKNDMGNVTANQNKAISDVSASVGQFMRAVNTRAAAAGAPTTTTTTTTTPAADVTARAAAVLHANGKANDPASVATFLRQNPTFK